MLEIIKARRDMLEQRAEMLVNQLHEFEQNEQFLDKPAAGMLAQNYWQHSETVARLLVYSRGLADAENIEQLKDDLNAGIMSAGRFMCGLENDKTPQRRFIETAVAAECLRLWTLADVADGIEKIFEQKDGEKRNGI